MNHPDSPASNDTLAWSDAFLLGHGPMDTVHEEFVDIVGRLQRADNAALPSSHFV